MPKCARGVVVVGHKSGLMDEKRGKAPCIMEFFCTFVKNIVLR